MGLRRLIPLLTALWAIVGPTICLCRAAVVLPTGPAVAVEHACCQSEPAAPEPPCSHCDRMSAIDVALAPTSADPLPVFDFAFYAEPIAADVQPTLLALPIARAAPPGVGPPHTLLALGCMLTC